MDDFDFDDDGIYREKQQWTGSNDGILLDDDGIWHDDDDMLGHYTLRTDSGLGTADRKSSSSTLNKLHVSGTESGLLDRVNLHPPEDDDDYNDDSYPFEEKSLNISELEASDSASFDHDSLGSAGDLDLPDLNDSDHGAAGPDARYHRRGSTNGLQHPRSRPPRGIIDDTFESDVGLDFSSINDPSFLDDSNSKGFDERNSRHIHRGDDTFDQMDDSLFGDKQKDDTSFLASGRDRHGMQRRSPRNAMEKDSHPLSKMARAVESAPPIQMGDSLFTQEDATQAIYPQHSLVEFEELEDYLGNRDPAGDDGQMDLIGAYLQGIKDQEEAANEEEFEAVFNNNNQEDGILSARTLRRNQLPEDGSDFENDELIKEPYRNYRMDGRYIENGNSRGKSSGHRDDEREEEDVDLHPYSGNTQPFEELSLIENQSPPFSVLNSFNTDLDVSRDVSKSHDLGSDVDHSWMKVQESQDFQSEIANITNQEEDGDRHVEKQSKIPMLRSRSPSLSRPGSTNRSRHGSASLSRNAVENMPLERSPRNLDTSETMSQSDTPTVKSMPGRSRPRTRADQGRTLPATPLRNDSVSSFSSRSRSPSQGRSSRGQSPGGWSSGQSGSPTRRTSKRSLPVIQRSISPSPVRRNGRFNSSDSNQSNAADDLDSAASLLIEKEVTTPTRAQPPRRNKSPLDKLKQRRPSSADIVRSNIPKELKPKITNPQPGSPSRFRIRSNSAANIRSPQPLKATASAVGGVPPQEMLIRSKSFDADTEEQGKNDEVLKQLQQEYNSLLQKYALAENTIDSLRIGAKIPVTVDITANSAGGGAAVNTSLGGSQHGGSTPNRATGSATSLIVGGGAPPGGGSRPASRMSQHSAMMGGGQMSAAPGNETPVAADDGITSEPTNMVDSDGMKLSLLAKAKTVEDQMNALDILLGEKQLSLEDQDVALANIKNSYDKLQQDYHDTKDEYVFLRRQGRLGSVASDAAFDDDKTVEGELYKLNMAIDTLEHQVQENKKTQSAPRIPFQGALKADHSIRTESDGAKNRNKKDAGGLSPNRPPSVGSTTGGPREIDQKLHKLNKDYSQLMDRYRQLRQMRKTPERDREIDGLLNELREIYEASPDHRKPALPPELEKQYDAVHESWMPPEYLLTDEEARALQERGNANETEDGSLTGTMLDSDVFLPAYNKGKGPQVDSRDTSLDTSRKGSDVSSGLGRNDLQHHKYKQNSQQHRSRQFPQNPQEGYSSTTDSAMSQPFRKPLGSPHPSRLQQAQQRRREREDKDSGYVGSEASRRHSSQDQLRDRYPDENGHRHGNRRSERSGSQQSLDESDSVSNGSTVEYVRPARASSSSGKGGSSTKSRKQQLNKVPTTHPPHAVHKDAGLVSGARPGGHTSKSIKGGASSRGQCLSSESDTDSDVISLPARLNSANSAKNSAESAQLKNLQEEVKRLKDEMHKASPTTPATITPATIAPVMAAQDMQQPVAQQVAAQVNPATAAYNQPGYYIAYPDPSANNPYYNYYPYTQDGSTAYQQQNGYALPASGQPIYPTHAGSDQFVPQPTSVPDAYSHNQQYFPEYDAQVPSYDHEYSANYRDYSPIRSHDRHNYSNGDISRDYDHVDRRDDRRRRRHEPQRRYENDDYNHGYHSDNGIRTDRLRDHYIPTKSRDTRRSSNQHLPRSDGRYRTRSPPSRPYDKYQTHHRSGPDLRQSSAGWARGPRSAPQPPPYRDIQTHGSLPQGHAPLPQGHGYPLQVHGNPPQQVYHMQGHVHSQAPTPYQSPVQHPGHVSSSPVAYTTTRSTACPTCGGAGLHSHGNYVHRPRATAAPPVIMAPSTGEVQQTVGGLRHGQNNAAVVNSLPGSLVLQNGQPQQTLIPVQLVTAEASGSAGGSSGNAGKVRYYVREYNSEGEEKGQSSKHRKKDWTQNHKSSRRYQSGSGSESDNPDHDDLSDSINSAMRTAKELKRMSHHMKSTLKEELSKSYRDSQRSQRY